MPCIPSSLNVSRSVKIFHILKKQEDNVNNLSKLIVVSTVGRLELLFKSKKKKRKTIFEEIEFMFFSYDYCLKLSNKELNCQKERFSSGKCLGVQDKDGNIAVHKI